MLVRLRLGVPEHLLGPVLGILEDPGVAHLVRMPGASLRPAGDLVVAEVAREAADEVLDALIAVGLDEHGSITLDEVSGALSRRGRRAEQVAVGEGEDGVIWPVVATKADAESRGSYSYHVFLTLGCALAAIAVITDSPVLVIGAMVVSPDFAPVAAAAVGIVLRRRDLVLRAVRLLLGSFALAVAVVTVLALLGRATGLITLTDLVEPRPLTGFIWHPDLWSFVVAVLAGIAGTLSLTSGKSQALVGVFISVTTVPAAGNLALALAFLDGPELEGSLTQLGINVLGMLISGTITLFVLRLIWDRWVPAYRRRRRERIAARRATVSTGTVQRGESTSSP